MINHVTGNLIDLAEQGHFDVIVQGCNCQNTMGSGLAKEIKQRYPKAYDADSIAALNNENFLGNYSEFRADTFWIINAYTQYHYLPRGIDHFDYIGFDDVLTKLYKRFPKARFGFPYIGMGLAGGNPKKIINMIEDFAYLVNLSGGSVTLVEYKT